MRITYADIDFSELRGDLVADYVIAVDARLSIVEGERTLYEEPDFPVVELARSLVAWLNSGAHDGFEFVSLSAAESGIVTVAGEGARWQVYSSSTPDVRSSVLTGAAMETAVRDFIGRVRADLTSRGFDAARILGTVSQP